MQTPSAPHRTARLHTLAARPTAAFTRSGTPGSSGNGDSTGAPIGLAGECLGVGGAGTADGTADQRRTCNPSTRDVVDTGADRRPDVRKDSSADETRTQIRTCAGTADQKRTLSAS